MGEVLVTARNKAESSQDIPVSISALSTATLERRNITDISKVAQSISGLTYDQGLTPSDTRPAIRGVQAVRGRPNVAILVDGIDTSSEAFATAGGGALVNLRFVDAERIEVVKGPQSVLYGRSAFSGAINYISKKPNLEEFDGKASYQFGDFGLREGKIAVSGPLVTDKLAIGISFDDWDYDGQYRNYSTGARVGGGSSYGGSFSLLVKPTDKLTFNARIQSSHEEYSQTARAFVSSVNPTTGEANTANLGVSATDPAYNSLTGMYNTPGYTIKGNLANAAAVKNSFVDYSTDPRTGKDFPGTTTDATRGSFAFNYDSDWGTFTSLTGITSAKTTQLQDFDNSNYSLSGNTLSYLAPARTFYSQFYAYLNYLRSYVGTQSTVVPTGGLPAIGFSVMLDDQFDTDQQSQTLRWSKDFGRLRTSMEGLYFHEKADQINKDQFWMRTGSDARLTYLTQIYMGGGATAAGAYQAPTTTAKATADYPLKISRETDSLSWAGSAEYDVTDKLTVRVDGRYIDERIAYRGSPYQPMYYRLFGLQLVCLQALGCSAGPAATASVRAAQIAKTTEVDKNTVKDHAFTPNFVFKYKLTDRNSVYASYGEGFKPGGVDTTGTSGSVDTTFKPEELDTYEIGSKNVFLGGDLVVNGAIFYNAYKNQQIGTTKIVNNTSVPSVENAGESVSKGFELESDWRVNKLLTLSANYTYTHARFTDYVVSTPGYFDRIESNNGDYTGKTVPLTPTQSWNVSALFTGDAPKMPGWTWTAELTGRYQSKRYITQSNLAWLPEHFLSDLHAGITDGSWSIDLSITNLLNDDTPVNAIATTDYGFFDLNNNTPVRAYVVSLPDKRAGSLKISKTF